MLKEFLHRIYRKLEIKDHPLLYLFLEITRQCNLSCLHCGSDCRAGTDPELSTDSWIRIIDYIHERFGSRVTPVITGGEPLIHPDLFRIAGKLGSLGMRWGMVTNGMLLTRDILERLGQHGLVSMTVSLDGMTAGHEKLRNRTGSWKKAVEAAAILGKSGLEFRDAVTCVYPGNIGELDDVAETLAGAGLNHWRLFRIFPLGRAKNNPELTLGPGDTRKMLEWIAVKKPELKKRGLNLNYSCEGYMPFSLDRAVRDAPFFCRAGVNIASILTDGNITGCSNNPSRFYQGNVLKDDFQYVWEKRFGVFRNRDWVKTGKCGACRDFGKCGGSSIHLWDNGSTAPEFCYLDAFK